MQLWTAPHQMNKVSMVPQTPRTIRNWSHPHSKQSSWCKVHPKYNVKLREALSHIQGALMYRLECLLPLFVLKGAYISLPLTHHPQRQFVQEG